MKKGHLSEYFEGVGVKQLSVVDAEPGKSNQHEIGTTVAMREFLGTERTEFTVRYIWIDDNQGVITEEGKATHYNAREGKPRAAEYRFYYASNSVTELMSAGDTLFLAKCPRNFIRFIVVPFDSTIQNQLLWLFGIDELPDQKFKVQNFENGSDPILDFASRFVLEELGIDYDESDAAKLDTIIDKFGLSFPSTAEFSRLARKTLPEIDAKDDADKALLAWLSHEEAMFRRLEKRIVASRIAEGFATGDEIDVDGFIKYSLGVQNRRKSRMGHSFENHLRAIFDAHGIKYDHQVITEKGKKPDFIFPGKQEYFDSAFRVESLTMLAAKSTCKDRWPQVLPEAERIERKHLATLEPAISQSQTNTMRDSNVQLVVPNDIQDSYTRAQREWLWSVADFLHLVLHRQSCS